MTKYAIKSHIHTPEGSIKPDIPTLNDLKTASIRSTGWVLTKVDQGDRFVYYYHGKLVKIISEIWDKETGILLYTF